jgi:hypothetical protein
VNRVESGCGRVLYEAAEEPGAGRMRRAPFRPGHKRETRGDNVRAKVTMRPQSLRIGYALPAISTARSIRVATASANAPMTVANLSPIIISAAAVAGPAGSDNWDAAPAACAIETNRWSIPGPEFSTKCG